MLPRLAFFASSFRSSMLVFFSCFSRVFKGKPTGGLALVRQS